MRLVITLLLLIVISSPANSTPATNFRQPQMAVAFSSGDDNRKWTSRMLDRSQARILMEMVPEGTNFKSSVERVENQIVFTPATLNNYMKVWLLLQREADNEFKTVSTIRDPHSMLVIYRLPSQNILAVRKFMKADDGVYMLAYQVKEDAVNYDVYSIWLDNIKTARLIENPERLK